MGKDMEKDALTNKNEKENEMKPLERKMPDWVWCIAMVLFTIICLFFDNSSNITQILNILLLLLTLPSLLSKKVSLLCITAVIGWSVYNLVDTIIFCNTYSIDGVLSTESLLLKFIPFMLLNLIIIITFALKLVKQDKIIPPFLLGLGILHMIVSISPLVWSPGLLLLALLLCCFALSKKSDLIMLLISAVGGAYALLRILTNWGSWELIKCHMPLVILLYALLLYFTKNKPAHSLLQRLWFLPAVASGVLFHSVVYPSLMNLLTFTSYTVLLIIWALTSPFTKRVSKQDIIDVFPPMKELGNIRLMPKTTRQQTPTAAPDSTLITMEQLKERLQNGEITKEEYKKEKLKIIERY